ncbi:MAG TPA: MFS transporter [Verrucomicrobiae bacterium]|nr:MFS transporter [Verrucomicrobiae bacterium]
MLSSKAKTGVFFVETLNAIGTTCYFYYIFFFAREKFDFGRLENLLLGAGLGLTYAFSAAVGGGIAQRAGYYRALKLGTLIMAVVLAVGGFLDSLLMHFGVMAVCTFGMGMTWPALQALISEGERRPRMQRMIGIYNLIWSLAGALAYMSGGAMLEAWGLRSMFFVPAAILSVQFLFLLWLESKESVVPIAVVRVAASGAASIPQDPLAAHSPVKPETFLKMAWWANPFAYLTINTVIAVSPSIADALSLSKREAGFAGSVWMFARTAAFVLFWLWPGWHYRFRWLVNSYLGMIASFVAILLSPNLAMLITAQVAFGLCIGLIYYSSLYYSMDVGETKGEHGGFHEAAIGAGSCAGPAVGAAALYFNPGNPHSSAFAASALLLVGLGGLIWMRLRRTT